MSITEYIEKSGPVTVRNGVLNLSNKDLTSLNGIELITKEPNKVTALDLSNNKLIGISASQIEMFPNLERLDLRRALGVQRVELVHLRPRHEDVENQIHHDEPAENDQQDPPRPSDVES